MKQILTIAMLLTSLASYAQDTLCVMVCLDRVLHFDYSTNEIIGKEYTYDEVEIKVKDNEVLVLHFLKMEAIFITHLILLIMLYFLEKIGEILQYIYLKLDAKNDVLHIPYTG